MFTRICALMATLAMALMPGTFQGYVAQAQTDQQWDWCTGSANVSEQQQVNACTQILNSGHLSTPERGEVFYHRAHSYIDLRQYRAAIQDLDQAIGLDPEHADCWWERHIAKERLGDNAGAQADYNRAKQIDPNIDR